MSKKLNSKNITRSFGEVMSLIEAARIPAKARMFYFKGKWRKLNKSNAREFIKEVYKKYGKS